MAILRSTALLIALTVALPAVRDSAGSGPPTEAQIKAGFLYNFAVFVEWPSASGSDSSLVIGVMADHNLGRALQNLEGRDVNGRKIAVRAVAEQDDIGGCAILFMPAQDDRATAATLARVGDAPVLTVGESPRFTTLGGIIRLYKDADKLRFEVNVNRAQRAGLRISSKMLGLAKIAKEGQ